MSQISLILINCTPRLSSRKAESTAGLWEFVRLEEITEAHFDKLFRAFVHGTKSRVSTSKLYEFANATIRDGSGSVLGQVYRKGTNDMRKGFISISVAG
jgi:hypothetical protein